MQHMSARVAYPQLQQVMCLHLKLGQPYMACCRTPPSLTGFTHTDSSPPQGKLLPRAEVHEVRLVVQLLEDDVLPFPLVQ